MSQAINSSTTAAILAKRLLRVAKSVALRLKAVRLDLGGAKRGCFLSIIDMIYYDVWLKFKISMSAVKKIIKVRVNVEIVIV